MRRSTQVAAPLLALAAAAMLQEGCRRPEMQRNNDGQNAVVVEDARSHLETTATVYRYYYGGDGDAELGTSVDRGNLSPTPDHAESTKRGGFGSSFDLGQIILATGVLGLVIAFGKAGG